MVFITKQLWTLIAQSYKIPYNLLIVVIVVLKTFFPVSNHNFFAKLPVFSISNERAIAWIVQGKNISLQTFLRCQIFRGFYGVFRQSVQIVFVCNMQFVSIGFRQYIFVELQRQNR